VTRTNNTLRTTKTKKALYWASTGFAAAALAGIGAADLAQVPDVSAGLAHLGYPPYFATIIGVWKLLAVAAILAPGMPRLKEWAYAGLFFTLTGAAMSHVISGDALQVVAFPLVILGIVVTSRALQSARRAAVASNSSPMPSAAHA